MVNWDPKALTALSDEEVVLQRRCISKLYYLRYKIEGEDGYALVATTRSGDHQWETLLCVSIQRP